MPHLCWLQLARGAAASQAQRRRRRPGLRLLPRREPGQPVMWLLEAWTVAAVHASVTGEFISGAGLEAVPIIRL